MRADLLDHTKLIDELGNTVEMKLWRLPEPTADKPHGYKYSLVYIVDDIRIVGYDNAEGKGYHKHIRLSTKPYRFANVDKLMQDFFEDVEKYKRGEL